MSDLLPNSSPTGIGKKIEKKLSSLNGNLEEQRKKKSKA
jgi:hypothetical protein